MATQPRFRFSVRALLWIVTLLCLGMNAFGVGWGLLASISILCVHYLFLIRWKLSAMLMLFVLLFGTILILVAREASAVPHRQLAMSKAKTLTINLLVYNNSNGQLPRPYVWGEDGTPLHSWRFELMPFLSGFPVYVNIDKSLPWDDPVNLKILERQSSINYQTLRCEPDRNESNFFAVVDEVTVWSTAGGITTSLGGIEDGNSYTVLLIEVKDRGTKWYEPEDLTMEEAIDILTGEVDKEFVEEGFWYSTRYRGDGLMQRAVAFADGQVMMIGRVEDRKTARALLTRAGGEELPADWDLYARTNQPIILGYQTNWARIISLVGFVGLAFWPFRSKKERHQETA